MSLVQLNPPIPVMTPDGPGLAYFVRDYGIDHDDYWTVVPNSGSRAGEFWTYSNKVIRAINNATLGRKSHVLTSMRE